MANQGLPDTQLVIVAVLLLLLGGLFAMTDSSLQRVSAARVTEMVRDGVRGAKALQAILGDRLVRHLNLLLLLRVFCELGATTLVALVVFDSLDTQWLSALIVAGSMTILTFVVVGVAPRTIGRQHAYTVARYAAPIVRWLGRVLNPLASLLILIGNAFTPGKGFRDGPFASQVELRELVDLAEQRGFVEHGERDMIHSVFALGDTIAREVMVPRTDMVYLAENATLRQARALALRSGFSRVPLIGENIDDVLGIVYLKDVIKAIDAGRSENDLARDAMRPAIYVPESKPVDDLLSEMQAARTHMAIIVDEYDVERPPVEHLGDGSIRVTARLPVEDLGELFDVDLPGDEVETVGGLLAQALGRVPIPGARATVDGLLLTAEGTTGRRNRIDTVLVRRAEPDDKEKANLRERQSADV